MTDSYIPEEIIDRVVEQIAELDNDAVRAHMKRCGPFQPELTGFVLAYMADRLDLVRALSTIGMITAYEAFRAGYVKTRKARERLVKRTWEDVADFIAQLADEFHRPHHLSDDDLMSSEPALMGALMELAFAEDSETAAIPAEDAWHLLAVLYNIVETLHESAGAPRFPAAVEPMDEPDAASIGTGIAWYTPEQWERMRETADDPEDLDACYDDWLAGAMTTERGLLVNDIPVQRVMIDVDEMRAWLAERGRRNTSGSRAAYVVELRRKVPASS